MRTFCALLLRHLILELLQASIKGGDTVLQTGLGCLQLQTQ